MNQTFTIEVGLAFVPVIGTGSILKEKVEWVRNELKSKQGKELPLIHVYENPSLEPYHTYRILVDQQEKKKGTIVIKKEEKAVLFTNTLDVLVEALKEVIQTHLV